DDRHERRRVGHQHGIEQRLVASLEVRQQQVLLQIAVEVRELGMRARHLHFQRADSWRKQSLETERTALRFPEGGSLVEPWIVKKIVSYGPRRAIGFRVELGHTAPRTLGKNVA